jgi:nitrate reductase cytochrome c-type subunit
LENIRKNSRPQARPFSVCTDVFQNTKTDEAEQANIQTNQANKKEKEKNYATKPPITP